MPVSGASSVHHPLTNTTCHTAKQIFKLSGHLSMQVGDTKANFGAPVYVTELASARGAYNRPASSAMRGMHTRQ